MEENIERFMEKYKELKVLVYDITETLESYMEEALNNVNKFEEFLADYSFKISAVVFNTYDEHKKKIFEILDWMDKQIEKDETFKDLNEYTASIRAELNKFESLYEQGSVEEDEINDIKYCLELPFEDLETIFNEEEWDYEDG